MLQIRCKNNGLTKTFNEGVSLLEVFQSFDLDFPYPVISAKVNNASQGLKFRLWQNRDVEFVDVRDNSGFRTYIRSLCFVLYKATQDVFPDSRLYMEHPISHGYFCNFKKAQIIIWWMSSSFQYNDLTMKTSKRKMFHRLKFLEERCLHLYEGESAGRDLLYHGITNRMRFSHGVHPLFYTQKPKVEKQDIVCYNPFKPANAEFIKVIKAAMPDVKFVPIGPEEGNGYMTKEELIDVYDSAKVYVDFNEFEGREMCPREAALRDCVLLLNNEGCASTFDDYPIPNWNKIEKYGEGDVDKICEKIRYCLDNYETCLQDMSLFKNKCLTEPAMWKLYVQTLFGPMIPEENKLPQQV